MSYEEVNAMLLNEFLKEHRKVEAQDQKMASLQAAVQQLKTSTAHQAELESTVSELKAAVQTQAVQIQKVRARWEASRVAPQLVSAGE